MKYPILFVGAGPGAEDLLTLRALRAIEDAELIVYAGSLVNPLILDHCRKDCQGIDSAGLNLYEQIEIMAKAARAGKKVVRLHSGDPSLYGAINEQIRELNKLGITVAIIPGVSSVCAAAAALGCELTNPECSQSVVLTRTQGRTPMPEREDSATFAKTGATLVFFLSIDKIAPLMQHLQEKGQLGENTPVAVVSRASWEDELILRGTVSTIAQKVEDAGFTRQALILVGQALKQNQGQSCLYNAHFSHGYRNQSEQFSGSCAFYAFTEQELDLAQKILAGLNLPAVIYSTRQTENPKVLSIASNSFDTHLASNWSTFAAHIFLSATGIAVRKIAPLLHDKSSDPAVICCSGRYVISLASGHLGGANRLSRRIASIIGGQAVIGTATDIKGLIAFDDVVAQENARILNTEAIKVLNTALLDGEPITFSGKKAIFDKYFALSGQIKFVEDMDNISTKYAVFWDVQNNNFPVAHLDISSKSFVLGIGCRKGVDSNYLQQVAENWLSHLGLSKSCITSIATCDLKKEEPALQSLSKKWDIPLLFYSVTELNSVPVPTPSEKVLNKIGSASVCEAAALLGAGFEKKRQPDLYAPKAIFTDITLALARMPHLRGSSQPKIGKVVVVGISSGAFKQITPEVQKALRDCDTVAGYTKYIDLIRDHLLGKILIENGMRGEIDRCQLALKAALDGHNVCMVCSGDPGILAMAGLIYELKLHQKHFSDISIQVLPGITAASIAAASLGAPLQNGFALMSLSDLLIPKEELRHNLKSVVQSDLPIVIYNPAGRIRRELLSESLEIVKKYRGEKQICAFVKNAGREKEVKWIGTLADFPLSQIDMSTLVIFGGSRTHFENAILYDARGYREKYLRDFSK